MRRNALRLTALHFNFDTSFKFDISLYPTSATHKKLGRIL